MFWVCSNSMESSIALTVVHATRPRAKAKVLRIEPLQNSYQVRLAPVERESASEISILI